MTWWHKYKVGLLGPGKPTIWVFDREQYYAIVCECCSMIFGNTRVMLWPREDCVNVKMEQTELSFSNDTFTYTVWQWIEVWCCLIRVLELTMISVLWLSLRTNLFCSWDSVFHRRKFSNGFSEPAIFRSFTVIWKKCWYQLLPIINSHLKSNDVQSKIL